ncbi:hypothetical protein L6R53_03295 [Myxococcota bacterium]|nr:hypothetical protein [Myxococcota bacterium]
MTGPPPSRAPGLATAAAALLLSLAAMARQQALAALSPLDLAFFTQSACMAARGRGFAQTVLSFDGSTLGTSVHLSPDRLLQVPAAALAGATGLAGLQGAAVGLGLGAVAALAQRAGATPRAAAILVLAAAAHPLTLALATADARPITFMVPGVLWAAWALQAGRPLPLALAGLLTIGAREEAPLALAGLLPWAAGRSRASQLTLVGLVLLALALPLLTWGHSGSTSLHDDPGGALRAILAGARPLLRDPGEARFLLLCLLAAPAALFAPRLLLPGLLGWLALISLSQREPAHPTGAGMHYLALACPLLLAAAATGAGRLCARGRAPAVAVPLTLLALAGAAAAPGWSQVAGWAADRLGGDLRLAARQELLDAPRDDDDGGVLAVSPVVPPLACRAGLWVPGHVDKDPAARQRVARAVDWALLPDRLGSADEGLEGVRPEELEAWRGLLEAEGLAVDRRGGGLERWRRVDRPLGP